MLLASRRGKRLVSLCRRVVGKRCFSSSGSNASSSSIPIIDFGRYHGNEVDRKALAKDIDEACTDIGFFAIVNHGVDENHIENAWTRTREFFDLSSEVKSSISPSMTQDYPYGYIPLGGEKLAAGRDAELQSEEKNKSAPPDLNESFSMGPEATADNGAPGRQWPTHDPAFAKAWSEYYTSLEHLSSNLLEIFALALKLPSPRWFEDKIDRHRCALRALHYPHPEGPVSPDQLRASAHTDYGSLTILLQDSAPGGLQVKAADERSGGWTPVPREEGAFVINLGDLMSRWTNERWVSTLHRVVMPPPDAKGSTRRQSMAFFHNINPDHVVRCIETCHSPENPPKYEPIKAFDFLMKKHAAATGGS